MQNVCKNDQNILTGWLISLCEENLNIHSVVYNDEFWNQTEWYRSFKTFKKLLIKYNPKNLTTAAAVHIAKELRNGLMEQKLDKTCIRIFHITTT